MAEWNEDELAQGRDGYSWVYRRRLAIIQACPQDPLGAFERYDMPPYPCDGGYWWFRVRDALGLTRKPPA